MFLSDEGPTPETLDFIYLSISAVHQPFSISICIWTLATLETWDFTIHICSTPTLYISILYLNTAYAAHYVYID